MRFTEGTYDSSWPTGTGHGSAYWYDRWVPVAFLGRGVSAGSSTDEVYTVDVAPTLAGLAGVTPPADVDGRRIDVGRGR